MKNKLYVFLLFYVVILCFFQSLLVRNDLNKTEAANMPGGFLF